MNPVKIKALVKITKKSNGRVTIFGKLAEIAAQYLIKSSKVYFEGKVQARKWHGGKEQDRYSTKIETNEIQVLGGRADSSGGKSHSISRSSHKGNHLGFISFRLILDLMIFHSNNNLI